MSYVKRVLWLAIGSLLCSFAGAQVLSDDNFDRWLAFILPKPAECRFEAIPWRTSLWSAVIDAQKEDKPILLWAMNGHPLGCT
ncbi:MAG: hypothetical protein IH851_05195 [Armatimonadetes bacterium]|nr:hypothetical protein [Armatimonadota bacterium]